MEQKIKLFDTFIDNLSVKESIAFVKKTIKNKVQIHEQGVNAYKIVAMQSDVDLRKSVQQADLIQADGQAVIWASKILKKPLKERIAGIDLMQDLVKMAFKNNYKIFFFGAREEVVKTVVETYTKKYNADLIAGYRNGYFNKDDESKIARQIADSQAQLLFVGISSPTQEFFLDHYRNMFPNVYFMMGVGGSFDVIAGKVKRAPRWMQKSGLEWFYRFLQEPGRMWKRYLVTNSKFIWMVFKKRITGCKS